MNLHRLLVRIKNSYLKREIVFAVDIVISMVASLIVILVLRAMLGSVQFFTTRIITIYLGVVVVASVGMFIVTHTSRIIIRHLSIRDLHPFILSGLGKGVALIVALAITGLLNKWWALLVVLDVLLTIFLIVWVRLAMIAVPNPAEMLVSDRFKSMIDELRGSFEYIFIDCPPVDVVADTAIVSRVADITIFVIRARLFDKRTLPMIENLYKEGKYKRMALILNGVEASGGMHGYGYGYGYGEGSEKGKEEKKSKKA